MKKRTLEDKIKLRINKSNKTAFVSSDFFDLSDVDQVGRVLRTLVKEEYLIKLGRGVFAKTKESAILKKRILAKSFSEVAKEALGKLNIKIFSSQAEKDYDAGISTQLPTGLMIAVNKRVARTLTYNGRSIKYERASF